MVKNHTLTTGRPNGRPKNFSALRLRYGPHSPEEQTMLKLPNIPPNDSDEFLYDDDLWLDADDIRLQCGVITPYEASLDSDRQEKAWH